MLQDKSSGCHERKEISEIAKVLPTRQIVLINDMAPCGSFGREWKFPSGCALTIVYSTYDAVFRKPYKLASCMMDCHGIAHILRWFLNDALEV
jgi:hypothetical protein